MSTTAERCNRILYDVLVRRQCGDVATGTRLKGRAPPNEMRLSCGALLSSSQTDGLHSKTAPSASGAC